MNRCSIVAPGQAASFWVASAAIVSSAVTFVSTKGPYLDWERDAGYAHIILSGGNPFGLGVVPRPPSGLLLQMPLAWIDPRWFSHVSAVVAFVAVSWLALLLAGASLKFLPALSTVVAISQPAHFAIGAGNGGALIACLFVLAWRRRSALAIALAGGLRLFPLVFTFVVGWRRVLLWFGVFMVGGLILVPDLLGAIRGLTENVPRFLGHESNSSISAALYRLGFDVTALSWVFLLLSGVVTIWIARLDFDHAMAVGALASVTLPAITWPSYHLMLIPVVGWLYPRHRWVLLAAVLWLPYIPMNEGSRHLMSALVIGLAVFEEFRLHGNR